jgi:hypothetical protein
MDSQELRNLQEAYLEVYQQIDEAPMTPADIERIAQQAAGKKKKSAKLKSGMKEQVDIYDIILSHLLDEGYAETPESAEAIMVNMSEEWRESVVEAYKDLPVGKMIRQAGRKQFRHGMKVGYGDSSNPKVAQQIGKMSAHATLHDPERAKAKSKLKEDWRDEIDEAAVDWEMTSSEMEKARNERKFGKQSFNQAGQTKLRRELHKSKRGMTKQDERRWAGEK